MTQSEPGVPAESTESKALPAPAGDWALFFDFDGTLVDIAPSPDLVRLAPSVRYSVQDLFRLLGGAVAVVTGRPLADIDRYLGLPDLPVAGSHGLEIRTLRKLLPAAKAIRPAVDAALAEIRAFAHDQDGLLVEEKPAGIALHYRARPDLAAEAASVMTAVAGRHPGLELIEGKMVFELRPRGTDKGTAVNSFMAEAPFAGRRPVFIGDDRTDEDAFAAVQGAGGFGVKIGEGETVARYRIASAAQVRTLLAEWAAILNSSQTRAIA